jgi:hypothetical protein
LAFILCGEKGVYGEMARLLVASIRKYGGRYKDAPIRCYAPRRGMGLEKSTLKFFEKLNVSYFDLILNKDFHDYPLANKIVACSHAEKNTRCRTLVFLDSDIFVLSEPSEFDLDDDVDIALRPVDSKNIGCEGEKDENYPYWEKIYNIAGVTKTSYITTTIDRKKIFSSWTGGHLVVKREMDIFQQWEENFLKTMELGLKPGNDPFYVEQSVFAATVSAMDCRISTLSPFYNYPIHLHSRIPDPKERVTTINDIISAHYHRIFRDKWAGKVLEPLMDPDDSKSRWLMSQLIAHNIIEKRENFLPKRNLSNRLLEILKVDKQK